MSKAYVNAEALKLQVPDTVSSLADPALLTDVCTKAPAFGQRC